MPVTFLTFAERERLSRFPKEVPSDDIFTFFTLSERDMAQVPATSADYNRLGFALQLCTMRYLGFCPDDIATVPPAIVSYVADQIGVKLRTLTDYGQRGQTRTEHLQKIQDYLGFRKADSRDMENLLEWLTERAMEHDKPILLFHMGCERLYSEKIIRPGLTYLERMIATARQKAQEETYNLLNSLMTEERLAFIDNILITDNATGRTPLFWLRHGATSNTPSAILKSIDKLLFLRESGVEHWDLSNINPNRKKVLSQIGRRSTNQALQRLIPQRRYPVLIAFLRQSLEDITDELVDLFIQCLTECHARSKRDLKEYILGIASTTSEKLRTFQEIGTILLDPRIPDSQLRNVIYSRIPEEELRSSLQECTKLIRPKDDKCYDYLASRYSYIREFAPRLLEIFKFCSNIESALLIEALEIIKKLNSERKRALSEDAPLDFVPKSWLPYVVNKSGKIDRRYYEICALWELRSALRSGDIWVENSRNYADPETYLIPHDQWHNLRPDVCQLLNLSESGEQRLKCRLEELEKALSEMDRIIPYTSQFRIEDGNLIVSALKAENGLQNVPESVEQLQALITGRLPRVELTDLLIEVDNWTHFTDSFEHAGGNQPMTKDVLAYLYASIMAQACNFGLSEMAEISDLSYKKLAWCTNWYIREETLQTAINTLVNYQYNQTLSAFWGGGILSSSDGQRFPVPIKARNISALPRYFGYGRGLTFYSWTSDQFSQYGSKVIPATVRDATYVLDAILDNETELQIVEHTTDTAGYTELVFALFDLLGMRFSPRIRDLGDQKIYRVSKTATYKHIEPLLHGSINQERILKNWDDILRVVASLKFGWVTASLFISKLQAHPRKNLLTKAIQEYGRLNKSIYIPTYLCKEEYMRRVNTQLNKGESLHKLRRFLAFANEGNIRKSQIKDQINQASSLTLLTNAIIVWNTRYMQAVIDRLKDEGYDIQDSDLRHISPCRFEHINKYGKYRFNVEEELGRKELRPLCE